MGQPGQLRRQVLVSAKLITAAVSIDVPKPKMIVELGEIKAYPIYAP